MAIDKIFGDDGLDGVADSVFSSVNTSIFDIKAMQQRKVAENVQVVIKALKKIESDLQDRYDGVTTVIEKRVSTIRDGKDGQNGANGRDGKDGRPGRDGAVGPRGMDGLNGSNGRDGEDGVSVTNAFIDFDGSLVINLSDGQSLNVGEVVAPDLAEKIKVITNGGGTSQGVLDTLTSLQNQINALVGLGAVNYVGTWNASTNTPTIVASTGDKGDYYVVSVAGSTSIDGQTLWGVGDWIIFNGAVWQRVDGGSTGNFTDLTASGTVTLSAGEANGVAFLNGSKVLSSSSFFTYDDSTGVSLLKAFNQSGTTSFTGTTNIGSSVGTSTANPFFQFQGRNDWPFPQILRFQADYVSGADSGMGLTISSRIGNGTFQNRYKLLADGTAHIWSLGASGSEQMRLTTTGLGIGTSSPSAGIDANKAGVAYSGNVYLTGKFTDGTAALKGVGLGYDNSSQTGIVYAFTGSAASNLAFYTYPGSGSIQEQMRLDSSGNLGIGTTSPSQKLTVVGGIASTTGISALAASTAFFDFNGGNARFAAVSGTTGTAAPILFSQYSSNGSVGRDAMTLDSSGNLGLGVTPSAWGSGYVAAQVGSASIFSVAGGSGGYFIGNGYFNGSAYVYQNTAAATRYEMVSGQHAWSTAPSGTAGDAITFTQAMTLDASGRLGVGNTSPTTTLSIGASAGSGGYNGGVYLNRGSSSYNFYEASDGTNSIIFGLDNTVPVAKIGSVNSFPIGFFTGNTERARIDSSGNLLVGTTSAINGTTLSVDAGALKNGIGIDIDSTTPGGYTGLYINRTATNGDVCSFAVAGAAVGSISVTGSATSYNTTSDYRLKTVIGPVADAGQRIDALQPVEYTWNSNGSRTRGFLAHQFQEVYAGSVTGSKDEVDTEGKPVYQAMQSSSPEVIADLVAEIQSLRQRLAAAGI